MNPLFDHRMNMSRRHLLGTAGYGIGAAALAQLCQASGTESLITDPVAHYAPKAKRVIHLTMSGAPSQIETFDHKPQLEQFNGTVLPDSVRMGQRVTGMTAQQKQIVHGSLHKFQRYGKSGVMLSEHLPHTGSIIDDLCLIKSVSTDQINHAPAMTFMLTGHQIAGRPSMGSWLTYGLGSPNSDLPGFVVLASKVSNAGGQPLYDYYWGPGFLPGKNQGVMLRSEKDAVLYLQNPPGVSTEVRRTMLDRLAAFNERQAAQFGDPEIRTRIAQYELAYRMQQSVPELTDLSGESEATYKLYGEDARRPGTFAANCLLARRLAERGVRYIQLFHPGWDHHDGIDSKLKQYCKDTDQASAALVKDLKQRGMLDDTLVIWGGEFGRSPVIQGKIGEASAGRDHHPRCFSMWMAGGGVKPGVYGETDDFSFNVVQDKVHVHDLQATILHLLGLDHEKLTFRHQGRAFRLTDVHGHVVKKILV
ncbi:DUF1501 domain-containing protein [Roseibacillus persicicus]|uniref:Sulfatase n=1 Tax=Roseibacillus persicicus TaxID=454148 RepID=A0A918TLX8_9BACT|nr:DUF1501 domain-containing protein [Roseibacillus persicicus]MDQ8190786.1 DUF1501 domain-containing protein [Roseibacillus persicicus]GHC54010.1 sulfatase [Roseibacillus persicicus]